MTSDRVVNVHTWKWTCLRFML